MSYLSYLPFSMTFVSNDKLHKRCAPLFLATCGRMHDAIMLSASPSTPGTAMTIELKMLALSPSFLEWCKTCSPRMP